VSEKLNAKYKRHGVKDGDILPLNENISLRILETPGHSPDSISIVLQAHNIDQVVFTGDALLFGDVGRPDLREYGNHENEQRTFLAKQLYHTVHEKFATLNDSLVVYPAHGAGSLCGNATHNVTSSTIGYEKAHNHAFQHPTEKAFVDYLLSSLSFVPQYFPYDVEHNRVGSNDVKTNLDKVKIFPHNYKVPAESIVVDIRPKNIYSKSYFKNAINIQEGTKFETWFGTVINPNQKFFLVGQDEDSIHLAIAKLSKIGYETHLNGAFTFDIPNKIPSFLDGKKFILPDQQQYTIIDVRNANEFNEKKLISSSINIPLPDLAKGKIQIPKGKPIVVHCASGYRSAIAASILRNEYPDLQILDLGEEITNIQDASAK
ncbi:MAG: MBL fold metallo-hydrolase, partial [Pseudopedobacter saltans]